MIKMELVPFVSVGPFVFNSAISNYADFSFIELKEEFREYVGWISYTLADRDIRIYVDQDSKKIEAVACNDECIYEGKNLIGLEREAFINFMPDKLARTEIMELDDADDEVLEYDELEIEAFVRDGFIVSISCSA